MASTSEISLAASLLALSARQDLIASNLANAPSTAFKRKTAAQEGVPGRAAFSRVALLPRLAEATDMGQGMLLPTGSDFHLALRGPGFFKVLGQDGSVRFTRSGELYRSPDGTLATPDGMAVLDENDRPVRLSAEESAFRVDTEGRILEGADGGAARLALVSFADPETLVPEGGGLFRAPPGLAPERDEATRVHQGHLERSNVEPISELVSMIKVQRSFQAATRVLGGLQSLDDSLLNATR